jgi:hypothetical protein
MRTLMMTLLVIGLLGPPSLGVINVKLTADGPDWGGVVAAMPGQTTMVHVWAQGTVSGIYSLAGDIVASGPGLAISNVGSLDFTPEFNPTTLFFPTRGTPGPNGGWVGFGSVRTDWGYPDANYGLTDYIEVCRYTLTVGLPWTWGPVTLTFAAKTVSGYKPLETDKTGVLGTISPLTLTVIPEPLTLALLALGGLVGLRRRQA